MMLPAWSDYVPADSREYPKFGAAIWPLFFPALAEYRERAHESILPLLLGGRGLALMLNGKPVQSGLLIRGKGPSFSFQDIYVFHDNLRCDKCTASDQRLQPIRNGIKR